MSAFVRPSPANDAFVDSARISPFSRAIFTGSEVSDVPLAALCARNDANQLSPTKTGRVLVPLRTSVTVGIWTWFVALVVSPWSAASALATAEPPSS